VLPELSVFLSDAAFGYRVVELVENLGEILGDISQRLPDVWGASAEGSACFIRDAAVIPLTLTRSDDDTWLAYGAVVVLPVEGGMALVFFSQRVDFFALGATSPPVFPTDPRPAALSHS
jgi:hypothetical protein